MYNLLITSDKDDWEGSFFTLDKERFLEREDEQIKEKYNNLLANLDEIKKLPCIFAYEEVQNKNPKFGYITNVEKRQGTKFRIEYKIKDLKKFISFANLKKISFDLDIKDWEFSRTHWSIKNIDLSKELKKEKINIPNNAIEVNNDNKYFEKLRDSEIAELKSVLETISFKLKSSHPPHHIYIPFKNFSEKLSRHTILRWINILNEYSIIGGNGRVVGLTTDQEQIEITSGYDASKFDELYHYIKNKKINNSSTRIKNNNKLFSFKNILIVVSILGGIIAIIWGSLQIYNYYITQKPILDVAFNEYTTTTTDKYNGITSNWIGVGPVFTNSGSVPIEGIRVGFSELNTSTDILSIPTYSLGNLSGKILGINEQISLEPSSKIVENPDPLTWYRFDVRYKSVHSKKERCKVIILIKFESRLQELEEYDKCPSPPS